MFLVKREESRDFDVFFGVFLGLFLVFRRERKRREELGREQISKKNVCPPVWGVPGSIYTPEHENRGAAIRGPWVAIQGPPAPNGF